MKLATPFQPPVAATVCKSISGTWNKTERKSCGQNISVGSISLQDECWCFIFHSLEKVFKNFHLPLIMEKVSTFLLVHDVSPRPRQRLGPTPKKTYFQFVNVSFDFLPCFTLGLLKNSILNSWMCWPPSPLFYLLSCRIVFPFPLRLDDQPRRMIIITIGLSKPGF